MYLPSAPTPTPSADPLRPPRLPRGSRPGTRRARRALALLTATTTLGVAFLGLGAVPAAQAATGSVLLSETFTGSSVSDAGLKPLRDTCLTGATAAPPAGQSSIGPCVKADGSPAVGTTPGYLQLSDRSGGAQGGVVYDRPLPANGGLDVSFDQYQYGGFIGADGIGFFLVDGSRSLTATGAAGGSLGYAQDQDAPGVDGGYLGVGLDAFGNFANDGQNKGDGCETRSPNPGLVPNSVTLRGPGDGLTGYCWMDTEQVPGGLRADTLEASQRTVRITVSADVRPVVTVYVDGVQTLQQTMTADAPSTFKFGFLASTGGFTDVHLIRNLTVSSLEPLGSLNLVKQVDNTTVQPGTYTTGDTVPYQFLVTNTSDATLTSVVVTDPKISAISCPRTTLGASGSPTASVTCTGAYTLTGDDTQADTAFTNTARATATDGDNTVTSKNSSVTVALTRRPGLSIVKTGNLDDTNDNDAADAGERVTYTFAVTNTGNTDLDQVRVDDDRLDAVTCDDTTLDPQDQTTCTGTYTVTQDDLDTGGPISNTATASGVDEGGTEEGGTEVTSTPSTYDIPVAPVDPAIQLVKTAQLDDTDDDGAADLGDTITYSLVATNTGNVTLRDTTVTDPRLTDFTCTRATLAPSKTLDCTGDYTVTQADIDAGTVANTATVTATPATPNTAVVTDTSSTNTPTATVVVPGQPTITTRRSEATTKPGKTLYDKVTVAGLPDGYAGTGSATLYGPFPTRAAAQCTTDFAVDTVAFTPRNGTVKTPKVTVGEPGIYTWQASTTADGTTLAATHPCGLAGETSTVRKATYDPPTIPAGYSGTTKNTSTRRVAHQDARLRIPSADISTEVKRIGIRKGAMDLPSDVDDVGLLTKSAGIGDLIGTSVIGGHVSDRHDKPGALYKLKKVDVGDKITYTTETGEELTYQVTSTKTYSRSKKLPKSIFATTGQSRLVVASCTAKKTHRNGHYHYTKNLVVTAELITR